MITEFLVSQWKLVLIAALMAALSFQAHRLSKEERAHVADNTLHRLQTAAAVKKIKIAQDTSTHVAKEINENIPKLVATAQANAIENYKRRYARLDAAASTSNRPSLGDGIHADGVRIDSGADTTGAVQADGAKSAGSHAAAMDVVSSCDPRFLNEAAYAAVIIKGWNDWANGNQLPREK